MVDIGAAKKEVKQVKIFVAIIALLQAVILAWDLFSGIEINYLTLGFISVALILNIITFIGLYQNKKYGLQAGFATGIIILINSLISFSIIGIIVAGIWLWSFYRIKPALTN